MNLHARKQMPEGESSGGGASGGGATPPWHGEFAADAPPEFKDWVGAKNYPNAQAALLSAFNAEKLIGADKERLVTWPKDENDAEGWKAVRTRLGVPEDVKGYELKAGEGENQEVLDGVAGIFAKHNVPKSAAQAFIADIRAKNADLAKTAATVAAAAAKAEQTEVETAWGNAANTNKELVRRFEAEMGLTPEDVSAMKDALGVKKYLTFMQAGGAKIGELGSVDKGGAGTNFGFNQAQAREKLEAARALRASNKMSEKDWLELNSNLSPIAYPSQAA